MPEDRAEHKGDNGRLGGFCCGTNFFPLFRRESAGNHRIEIPDLGPRNFHKRRFTRKATPDSLDRVTLESQLSFGNFFLYSDFICGADPRVTEEYRFRRPPAPFYNIFRKQTTELSFGPQGLLFV
ncbi:MAG: hypothetical protein ACOX6D_05790 [Thermoguttaceae bacterium]